MSRPFVRLIVLLVGAAVVAALWAACRRTAFQAGWTALRFRDSTASEEMSRALLAEDERLRRKRLKSGFQADVTDIVRSELELWRKQFHLGDHDRVERLRLQKLTEAALRERLSESLQDQVFQEQLLSSADEAAVRDWYHQHAETLRIPELHRVSHIFFTAHDPGKPDRQADVQAMAARLAAGESFASLASRFSEDARSRECGGELGWISQARMPEDFMAAVARQTLGRPGPAVRSRLGWHILLVHERQASRIPELEEVRSEIAALLDLRQRESAAP